MHELQIQDDARVKATPSRAWSIVATAIAVIGIVAAVGYHIDALEPAANAENYTYQREVAARFRAVAGPTAALAPFLSIVIGLLGRAWPGTLSGLGALLFMVVWVPPLFRVCCGVGIESNMIGVLREINSGQQAYSSSCANGKYAASVDALLIAPPGGTPFSGVDVGKGYWRGYRITMQTSDAGPLEQPACNGVTVGASNYFIEAHYIEKEPHYPHGAHFRNFAMDERGTIYQTTDGTVIQPGMAGAQPIQ